MSDFGVIIKFSKPSSGLTSKEIEKIEEALKKVVTEEKFPSNITEGDFDTLKEWDEDEYVSFISEYYIDEDEEELKAFAEEEDLPEATKIIELLKSELPSEIEMSAHLEEW
jgi:hypothetical protein